MKTRHIYFIVFHIKGRHTDVAHQIGVVFVTGRSCCMCEAALETQSPSARHQAQRTNIVRDDRWHRGRGPISELPLATGGSSSDPTSVPVAAPMLQAPGAGALALRRLGNVAIRTHKALSSRPCKRAVLGRLESRLTADQHAVRHHYAFRLADGPSFSLLSPASELAD